MREGVLSDVCVRARGCGTVEGGDEACRVGATNATRDGAPDARGPTAGEHDLSPTTFALRPPRLVGCPVTAPRAGRKSGAHAVLGQ